MVVYEAILANATINHDHLHIRVLEFSQANLSVRAVTVPGTTRPVPGRTGYQVPAPCSRSPDGREHGLNPGPRSPGDQVGRVYSRAPGDLVNGATVLDTWYRGTKPVSAGVSYLVPWALKHGVRY